MTKQAFIKQLPMVIINKILYHAISLKRNTIININQLLRFYALLYLRIQYFVSRVLFSVNLINFFMFMILSITVFLLLVTRYCYSALHCTIPMNSCLIRYGSNNLGKTSIDGNLNFLQLLLCNSLFIEKVFIFKDPG